MSNIGQEYNRGCFSTLSGLLAGVIGGATAAIVITVVVIGIALTLCFGVLFFISDEIDKRTPPTQWPTPGPTRAPVGPKSQYEGRPLMAENLANPRNPSTIRTNVLGGTLTVEQAVNLESMDFTPDPALVGKPIKLMDAHRKYNMPEGTIWNWSNSGVVSVIERDQKTKTLLLDESEVARAVAIFKYATRFTTPRKAAWILKKAVA